MSIPELHPKVPGQVLVLNSSKQSTEAPRIFSFSREDLLHIWTVLHELDASAREWEAEAAKAT